MSKIIKFNTLKLIQYRITQLQFMKNFTMFILLLLSVSVFGQKQKVIAKLAEYGISEEFLNTSLQDHDATHYFDIKTITNDGTKTTVDIGHFNPELPVGERWILESSNSMTPPKKELKKFDKAHNTKQPNINGQVDDSSWKIASDTDIEIVISFKYNKESLPNKFAFLADCTGSAYINKNTKRLKKATFVNDGPLKVKIFNVTSLDMTVDYLYIEAEKAYYMQKEHLDMKVKLLGQLVEIEETNEYSNYKKVK